MIVLELGEAGQSRLYPPSILKFASISNGKTLSLNIFLQLVEKLLRQPSASLRGARSLAYLPDMSRSLRAVRLAAGPLATFFNKLSAKAPDNAIPAASQARQPRPRRVDRQTSRLPQPVPRRARSTALDPAAKAQEPAPEAPF